MTPWVATIATAGGLMVGTGLALLVAVLLEATSRFNVPASQFLAAAAAAGLAFILMRRGRGPAYRGARTALGTSAVLLLGVAFVHWEGHAGGYYQNAEMRYFLERLAEAQDEAWTQTGRYLQDLPAGLELGAARNLELTLTSDGWTATVGHRRSSRHCAIYVGSTPVAPARQERRVRCTWGRLPARPTTAAVALLIAGALVTGFAVRQRRSSEVS